MDDAPGQKSRYDGDDDAQTTTLPDGWSEAGAASEAHLEHESGARLIIRRAAPLHEPTPGKFQQTPHKLDYEPPGQNRLIPVTEPGNKLGMRDAAREFASRNPDAEPTAEDMVEWIDEVEA